MKKLLIMVSALTAAVFSSAKADVSVSGSAGVHITSGGNVVDGDSNATSGTLFMNGAGVSFAMSTTTDGGVTISAGGSLSNDNDATGNNTAATGLTSLTFGFANGSITVANDVAVPNGTGLVGELVAHADSNRVTHTNDVAINVDDGSGIRKAASILHVALDFDYYEEQGHDKSLIVQTLRSRKDDYDPEIAEHLSQLLVVAEQKFQLQEIAVRKLEIGMRLAQELRLEDGFLVASCGADVDRQLLKVIRNYISCYTDIPFPKKIQVTVPIL